MDVKALWEAIIEQKADILRTFFHEDTSINWHFFYKYSIGKILL